MNGPLRSPPADSVDAGAYPRVARELLRHAPGSKITIERYARVTAGQQRQAADLLDQMLARAAVIPSAADSGHQLLTPVYESPVSAGYRTPG